MSELESTIAAISTQSARVAADHEALLAAKEAETAAEAELLDRVIQAAKPALRALVSRIRRSQSITGHASDRQRESVAYFPERGVRLYGSGPEEDQPRDNSGAFEGVDLYLLADGTWLQVAYSGYWSRWQGSDTAWDAIPTSLTTLQVARCYNVDDLIAHLAERLQSHAEGNRAKRTAAATARAEKLRAVCALLDGGRK